MALERSPLDRCELRYVDAKVDSNAMCPGRLTRVARNGWIERVRKIDIRVGASEDIR
jgi:hypothetical protein